jgi:hypothetical protein
MKEIKANDGLYCRNCNTYIYGNPDRIRKNHVCMKKKVKKKFIIFGKKELRMNKICGGPEFIPVREYEVKKMMEMEEIKRKKAKKYFHIKDKKDMILK